MGSTSEKISGKANELTGKAKQAVGDATGNRSMEAKKALPRKQRAMHSRPRVMPRTLSRMSSTKPKVDAG